MALRSPPEARWRRGGGHGAKALKLKLWQCKRSHVRGYDSSLNDMLDPRPTRATRSSPPLFLVLWIYAAVVVQRSDAAHKKASDVDSGGGLFPEVFNLATRASIWANATCGESAPEVYCKLVEHVRAPQCGQCHAGSPESSRRHPIHNAIDGSPRWWQSPTLQKGARFQYVTITLDLKQVYQVAYVIVKAAISPRPASWILERSLDGEEFTPWQFYAQTDDECWTRYGVPPTRGKPSYRSDSEVICTSYYSKLNPIEGGEIHTSLVNGRPGANESSSELQEFTLARFVRLRLQKIRTLSEEHISTLGDLDASVARRLFYSIKDISIGGQCACFGHANQCLQRGKHGQPQCQCKHNTCGSSCDECCPLFNQKPWQAGTPEDASECEPCQCFGHASSCHYDPKVSLAKRSLNIFGEYEGGGVCNNCTVHTSGTNCETCEDGWFRPSGLFPDDPSPCVPCDCTSPGSTGSCEKDNFNGKVPGQCKCKPGFVGELCDQCAPWYRSYPECEPCPCDPRGSDVKNCEKDCVCKANVDGQHCDHCKPGFFALDELNPDGCNECYCSGVSSICERATLYFNKVSSLSGWLVSDLAVTWTVHPMIDKETSYLNIGNYEIPGVDSYYWLASELFCGNKLTSYGTNLTFGVQWVVMRGDTSGQPVAGPLIILVGSNGLRLGYGTQEFHETNVTISIPLQEKGWYHILDNVKDIATRLRRTEYKGEEVSRYQFMTVLADIKHLLLRAKFNTDQEKGSLREVALTVGVPSADGSVSQQVERCLCPPGYTGLSCETCQYGYAKIGSPLPYQEYEYECRKCDCNGHAATCDPFTGICSACEHNTTGPNCGSCSPGLYGRAEHGTSTDCRLCACPLLEVSNNFSPTCELQQDGSYLCNNCADGYAGNHCEICASGYYGNPLELGSTCKPCGCHGGPCDQETGQCLECPGNTEGWKCERCKPGHYGNTSAGCHPCNCSEFGSLLTETCDEVTGQCECLEKYTGRMCDHCEPGLGNVSAGCTPCNCHPTGSASASCNAITGECECHPGVEPPVCNQCSDLYYNFSSSGCLSCGCHPVGSLKSTCDIVTGQCSCKAHATGRSCDSCQDGYWGLTSNRECQPCDCDTVGSFNNSCNLRTGQCNCKPGIGGQKCNECLPGYYGFSLTGCSSCEKCTKPGHICDPDTGRCVCPTLTEGIACERCKENSWGYEPGKGCKPCNCEVSGSQKMQCDNHSGRCYCHEGFQGDKCASCKRGYYGFPHCRKCDCNVAGTQEEKCDAKNGHCVCDETGQCPCKVNVSGKKCAKCKEGTFGLQSDNPDGCIQCFCFGRTTACTEAGLTWSQIMMSRPRTLHVEYNSAAPQIKSDTDVFNYDKQEINYIHITHPTGQVVVYNENHRYLNITNNLRIIPGNAGDIKIEVSHLFDAPLYWQLPQQFLGDKVLSYGGYLRFTIESEENNRLLPSKILSAYPLVQLQGNGRIILEHFPIFHKSSGHYEVRFHESLWRLKDTPEDKVTREMLMIALQNLQHVFIQATDSTDFTKVVLRDVSLDTAVAAPGQPPPLAKGVELCDCPPEYNSSSCQDPSIGFYRWYDNNVVTSTIVIQLVGEARPCQCNQRSSICDIETGYCQNCSENTSGHYCDRCAEGYYGDPAKGPCLPCPCPSTKPGNNFALKCRVSPGHVVCHCREGYTGKRCERCSYGWYGFPQQEGGSCIPCSCNPYGSVSDECHEETGQCNCRPGITGRDCSQCQKRYILTEHGCSSCDDGCTGLLLDEMDKLDLLLSQNAGHISGGLVPPPWTPLMQIKNNSDNLRSSLKAWISVTQQIKALPHNFGDDLKKKARALLNKAKKLERNSKNMPHEAWKIKTEIEGLENEVNKIWSDSKEVIARLVAFGIGENAINTDLALMKATELLNEIKQKDFIKIGNNALRILRECETLLKNLQDFIKSTPDITSYNKRLDDFNYRMNDMLNILHNLASTYDKLDDLNNQMNKKLNKLETNLQQINDWNDEIIFLADDSNLLVGNASFLLDYSQDKNKVSKSTQNQLIFLIEEVKKKEVSLRELNPIYEQKYVVPAREHAERLYRKYKYLRDTFSSSLQDAGFAIRASNAYKNIVSALRDAEEAAKNATLAADVAYNKAYPGPYEDSLLEKANIAKADSSRLSSRANQQQKKVTTLQNSLKEQKNAVNILRETVRNAAQQDNSISQALQKLKNDKVPVLVESALKQADKLEKVNEEIYSDAKRMSHRVETELRPRLIELDTDLQLSKVEEEISQTRSNIRKSDDLLLQLSEEANQRRKKFEQWNNTLSEKLQNLRDIILKARHAADGIHLSLTSKMGGGPGCVRSYKPSNLAPSITTSIILSFAIENDEKNSLLFYLSSQNKTTKDFIAVEMVNRRIRFLWDVGGGVGVITHPRVIETAVLKEDKHWYRIEVERTSNVAKLSVRPQILPDGSKEYDGNPQTNSTLPGFGRLDIGPNDAVWVGGLPPSEPVPSQLQSSKSKMAGCLHRVILDGRRVGLWNFHTEIPGSCTACIEGVEESKDEQSFRFRGDGYAVIDATLYDKYAFSVSLKFRTLDENSLIFMAVSRGKDQFVALTLREGKIIFIINYGNGLHLEIATNDTYNTGKWILVDASRYFDRRSSHETARLRVGDDSHEGAPPRPPNSDSIPDLSEAQYLIGGLPPGFKLVGNNNDIPTSFLGCMSGIQVVNEGFSPLQGKFYYGVEASCSLPLKVASFQGYGYLHLASHQLKKKSSFEFVFRTLQSDVFLMLSTNEGFETSFDDKSAAKSYYSAALEGGKVVVWMDAGHGRTVLTSNSLYNDGQFHVISVVKQGKKVELRVDDAVQSTDVLSGSSVVIKAPGKVGGLFFGGLPPHINGVNQVSSIKPLIGTIKDANFNSQLLQFEDPISFKYVEIGRLIRGWPQRKPPLEPQRQTWHNNKCQAASYSIEQGAVKFGDSPQSHIKMDFGRKSTLQKNYVLELDFRTFYPNGLLFFVADTRKKQRHYIVGALHNKHLEVLVRKGKKFNRLPAQIDLNDGRWHHLVLSKEKQDITLSIDSQKFGTVKYPRKLSIRNIMYLGGLPEAGLQFASSDDEVLTYETFKGCMRHLALNKQIEDLVGPKAKHHKVGQCFPNVETGSYFSGDAYAIYDNKFEIIDPLELELEFRTSELTGVLLSVSADNNSPAFSLELNNGKVVMKVDMGDGKPFRVEQEFASQYTICDNKWHRIQAFFTKDELTLKVDQLPNKYGLSGNGSFMKPSTNNPLFIGGLHDTAPEGTLETIDNFKGCIRNLKIGNIRRDWTDMAALHNILLNSCPVNF